MSEEKEPRLEKVREVIDEMEKWGKNLWHSADGEQIQEWAERLREALRESD